MNRGIRVSGRSSVSVERAAAVVRRLMLPKLPLVEPVNGIELFETGLEKHAHRLTGGVELTTDVQELPSGVEGCTVFDAKSELFCMTLSERTYRGLENGESRPRFTLSHEIGHLALHPRTLQRLGQLPHRELMLERSRDKHKPFEDSEWQANRFAAAFLMPAPGLAQLQTRGHLDEDWVAHTYHTSYEAAQYRINEFKAKERSLMLAWQKD